MHKSLLPYPYLTKCVSLIVVLAFMGLTSSWAKLQLFAATGFGGSNGELYILNPDDGSVIEDIGPLEDLLGNNYGLTGLRYDPSTGLLFGVTGSSPTAPNSFVLVNPNNALVTYIGGPLGSRLTDLAIDPRDFTAYGISGSSKYLFTVDKLTGIATRIGNTGLPPHRGGGFCADLDGNLYGTNDDMLYSYDKITGAATPIGHTGLVNYVSALAFSATGTLYGIEGAGNGDGEGSSRERWLVVLDTETGAATELGSTVGNLNALAFVPTP